MKCVCGYKNYHNQWNPETQQCTSEPDKKEFIPVKGTFLVENTGWHGGTHEVSLYACPECGTIQMKD